MIISCSDIEIILNELLAKGNKEVTILPFFREEKLFNINLETKKAHLKTTPYSWRTIIDFLVSEHSLSNVAKKELPEYNDIIKAVVSAGLVMPEGIDILIEEIKNYLKPISQMNRRKRFLIALDTNQLIDNLMSCYVEKEFSTTDKQQIRNFISYIISSWVLAERDGFMRNEKNKGLVELNTKLKDWNFYLPEKIGRKARLGYSIYSELKLLEESFQKLESRKKSEEKKDIMFNKNMKDEAIIEEYEEHKKSLKDVKFMFITYDDQAYALASDRLTSINVKNVTEIPKVLDCNFENGAKLIYQLTLFLGFIQIDNDYINFNIHYKGKKHDDWENKKLEFLCSNEEFYNRIDKMISTVQKLKELQNHSK